MGVDYDVGLTYGTIFFAGLGIFFAPIFAFYAKSKTIDHTMKDTIFK